MKIITDDNFHLNVKRVKICDFPLEFNDAIAMLRHTASNPLDKASRTVTEEGKKVMIFTSDRIEDMAQHLQATAVGSDFIMLDKMLVRNGIDILEIIDDIT